MSYHLAVLFVHLPYVFGYRTSVASGSAGGASFASVSRI
ncbi:hypothetical protein APHWI1_1026 [Anaplasma phagocytophilum str. ApWI1]|uniref:Uncharacterized protein n=2 Tax=Anaplasma phagocytophilum TaxID=948 RepID=A0A0F3NKK8_ANAPH|nr:hypothetical protein EPHNCH_0235 [Anaplasma phagocytophilum str. NCH-1]KJV85181.1 hypothetical protein APHWI1_1026 [Anaplasma phagocytophilum str. ApWI1]KJV86417.1 hypothetical protein APHNYW_1573 [Anaplasma phagocytophilum str. ApNYW]